MLGEGTETDIEWRTKWALQHIYMEIRYVTTLLISSWHHPFSPLILMIYMNGSVKMVPKKDGLHGLSQILSNLTAPGLTDFNCHYYIWFFYGKKILKTKIICI